MQHLAARFKSDIFELASKIARREFHLALRDEADLLTESEGEGLRRCVVVYTKDARGGGRPARKTLP